MTTHILIGGRYNGRPIYITTPCPKILVWEDSDKQLAVMDSRDVVAEPLLYEYYEQASIINPFRNEVCQYIYIAKSLDFSKAIDLLLYNYVKADNFKSFSFGCTRPPLSRQELQEYMRNLAAFIRKGDPMIDPQITLNRVADRIDAFTRNQS